MKRALIIISTLLVLFNSSLLMSQEKGVVLPPSNDEQFQGDTYAVVIGISDYQDPNIPDLQYADDDALAFASFLRSKFGGSLDEEHLQVLINKEATMAQFAIALDWLLEVTKENDRAFIYFSGHGDVEKKTLTQPGFLLCWDAPAKVYMAGGAFGLAYLQEIISTLSIQSKAQTIMITDACRSGKLSGSQVGGSQLTNSNLAKQYANEVKILSCQPDEVSIEGKQWGNGRGAFSYHLMDGLLGLADANEDLNVTLKEIGRYLEDTVTEEVSPQNQNPMIIGSKSISLSEVSPEKLTQLKEEKKGERRNFLGTETRGLEEEILAVADSITVDNYERFKLALKEKNFFCEDSKNCAEHFYQILLKNESFSKLHSSLRRNYAAALQDDAQQVINSILNQSIKQAVQSAKTKSDIYEPYPHYLERAAELLGKNHYMYSILQARKYYFEGRLVAHRDEYSSQGEIAKAALKKYRQSIEWNNEMPHVYHAMQNSFLKLDQMDSVKHYFNLATDLAPSWIYPYTSLANAYGYYNNYEEAEKYINKAIEIDSNSVFVLQARGSHEYYAKNYTQAINYFEKSIEVDSSYTNIYRSLANAYFMGRQLEDAEKYYKKALEIDSTQYANFAGLGLVYSALKKDKLAKINYEKAIAADPFDAAAISNFGYFYTERGQYDLATEQFEAAIEVDSTHLLPYINLCFLNFILNKPQTAIEYCKKCISKGGTFPQMYDFLTLSYFDAERYDEAKNEIAQIIERDSSSIAGLAGTILMQQKEHATKNEELLKKLLSVNVEAEDKLFQNTHTGFLENAVLYLQRDPALYPEALKLSERILAFDPLRISVLASRTNLLDRMNKLDEAMDSLVKLIEQGYLYRQIMTPNYLESLKVTKEFESLMKEKFPEEF